MAVLLAVAFTLLGVPAATAVPAAPADGVPILRLDGKGHGHGVGLSQWGARSMAAQGADAATILGHYYPGTGAGTAGGEVVVGIASGGRVTVSLPQGGELRSARGGPQADGFPIPLAPGEVVAIHHDGSGWRVERGGVRALDRGDAQMFQESPDCVVLCPPEPTPSQPQPEPEPEPQPEPEPEPAPEPAPEECVLCGDGEPAPGPAPEQPAPAPAPEGDPQAPRSPTPVWAVPAGGGTVHSVDRGRTYRGLFEVTGGPGAVRLRNHVDIDDYLRGMAEVPGTWPAAAVQAQTVAARTYALRAMAGAGEICDSESCQVYAGVARETSGQDAAVAATRGWVLTHGGGLAATFYSASAGGHSATVQEGFGSSYDIPYLPARPEPTDDVRPWNLEVSLADVAARLGYPGRLTDVRVDAAGPSGRPVAMTLVGDAGDRPVDPQVFRRRLGLRSTFFSVRAAVAGEAPPPPPAPIEQDQLVTAEAVVQDTAPPASARARVLGMVTPRSLDPAATPATARLGQLAVLGLLAGAVAWVALSRLHAVGRLVTADGLGASPLGAVPTGWREQVAATMPRWRNPGP
jgi:SpoIID/LytB domain protein